MKAVFKPCLCCLVAAHFVFNSSAFPLNAIFLSLSVYANWCRWRRWERRDAAQRIIMAQCKTVCLNIDSGIEQNYRHETMASTHSFSMRHKWQFTMESYHMFCLLSFALSVSVPKKNAPLMLLLYFLSPRLRMPTADHIVQHTQNVYFQYRITFDRYLQAITNFPNISWI